ncbi:MAG: Unknown protein [uncultured Sulfurovum sp.]|uniref:Uncharacterized protein n=1 Tax=uncultured Sulfurovum sp. TaxID=269237 RepID=A0A6S6SD86_9BACT|nr:MAG: Unknown protein [uncultured Sulfurovum sp.]
MKNTLVRKSLTALTIILLSQALLATESNISDNCLVPKDAKNAILDVPKFTTVWLKLNKDNNSSAGSQKHLEKYIQDALNDNSGTLDVEKFSTLWNKAGNNKNTNDQAHLQNALVIIVDKASGEPCSHQNNL